MEGGRAIWGSDELITLHYSKLLLSLLLLYFYIIISDHRESSR